MPCFHSFVVHVGQDGKVVEQVRWNRGDTGVNHASAKRGKTGKRQREICIVCLTSQLTNELIQQRDQCASKRVCIDPGLFYL